MSKKFRLIPLFIASLLIIFGVKVAGFSVEFEQSLAETSAPAPQKDAEPVPPATEDTDTTSGAPSGQLGGIPTRKEIEYLQKLSERRVELDRRARELDDREKLLTAVELRITERTASLKKIEATIAAALKKHDAREKAQLDSLVKIYASMKAKEAAKIFNNLDDDVLLSIAENMKEKNMGQILAKMNLDKAKMLTIKLATRERLPRIEG